MTIVIYHIPRDEKPSDSQLMYQRKPGKKVGTINQVNVILYFGDDQYVVIPRKWLLN